MVVLMLASGAVISDQWVSNRLGMYLGNASNGPPTPSPHDGGVGRGEINENILPSSPRPSPPSAGREGEVNGPVKWCQHEPTGHRAVTVVLNVHTLTH